MKRVELKAVRRAAGQLRLLLGELEGDRGAAASYAPEASPPQLRMAGPAFRRKSLYKPVSEPGMPLASRVSNGEENDAAPLHESPRIEEELLEIRSELRELRELSRRFDEERERTRAAALLRHSLRNPRQLDHLFMGGMTLGEKIRELLSSSPKVKPVLVRQLGIGEAAFEDLLEDRFVPDPELTGRLVHALHRFFFLRYFEVMILKAHTWSRVRNAPPGGGKGEGGEKGDDRD